MNSKNPPSRIPKNYRVQKIAIGVPSNSALNMYDVVQFRDIDGVLRTLSIPATDSWNETTLRRHLTEHRYRLPHSPTIWKRIVHEIRRDMPVRATVSHYPGFVGSVYLLGDGTTIGEASSPGPFLVLDPGLPISSVATLGDLDGWRCSVAVYAQNSSRIMLCLCAALSGYLLRWAGVESGGFHLYGMSSHGKSTCLDAAVSLSGPPSNKRTWSTTETALEELAARHSDGFFVLDELSSLHEDPTKAAHKASKLIFQMAEGKGKSRSRAYPHGLRPDAAPWCVCILSAGERSLLAHAAAGGAKRLLGEEVRFIDIPTKVGKLGIFEVLPEHCPDSATLIDEIKVAAATHYGLPQRAFILAITKRLRHGEDKFRKKLKSLMRRFNTTNGLTDLHGADHRFAKRFALAYAAGALAAKWKILPFSSKTVLRGISKCYHDAVRHRPLTASKQAERFLASIEAQREKGDYPDIRKKGHSHSKRELRAAKGYLTRIKGHKVIALRDSGLKALLPTDVLRERVLAQLRRNGRLFCDKENKSTRRPPSRMTGFLLKRCYCIKLP